MVFLRQALLSQSFLARPEENQQLESIMTFVLGPGFEIEISVYNAQVVIIRQIHSFETKIFYTSINLYDPD